ncbi:MAG: amino acid ABC transporter permease [Anaerolineales bacterium]
MATLLEPEVMRPPEPPGFRTWIRKNLFNNWINSLLTIVLVVFICWGIYSLLRWIFTIADWEPVLEYPILYLVGQYPREFLWRVGLVISIYSILIGMSWRKWSGIMGVLGLTFAGFILVLGLWPASIPILTTANRALILANLGIIGVGYSIGGSKKITPRMLLLAWLLSLVVSLLLLYGTPFLGALDIVTTNLWGGLLVTLLLAIGGITISFPFGVMLALGRRSSLPIIRVICTVFIETIRGVPLISILFLFSLILPLFLPTGIRVDRLIRALVGMTIFSAAYTAENVRGGLAAVPYGQTEAAKALGHSNFQITALIVLPQALRAVIPPIVGQFISLFKDTTLASGVAVLELLSVGRSILNSDPQYIGLQMEVYGFIALVFWILSYMMSHASRNLESSLGVGER